MLGALLLAESAWLYAGIAIIGVAMDIEGSPLGWTSVLIIMAVSLVVARKSPSDVEAIEMVYVVRTLVGLLITYLLISTQISTDSDGLSFEPGWLIRMGSEPHPYGLRAAVGVLVGIALWLRGARLAVVESPTRSLGLSFGLGVVVLALALIADTGLGSGLNTGSLVFVFFGAGLAGLSGGNLLQSRSIKSKSWPKIIGGFVLVVTLIGLLVSFLQGELLSSASDPVSALLGAVAKGLTWAVIIPIAFVAGGGVELFLSFFSRGEGFNPELGSSADPTPIAGLSLEELLEAAESLGEQEPSLIENVLGFIESAVVNVFQFAALALPVIAAMVALVILARLLRGLRERRPKKSLAGEREYVGEDADYVSDFGGLLWNLLSDRLRRRRSKGMAVPDGPPGIVEVFRIYYRLLKTAEEKGTARRPHQTTVEFQTPLETIVSRDSARLATLYFNQACYGHRAATEEELGQLRLALEGPISSPQERRY